MLRVVKTKAPVLAKEVADARAPAREPRLPTHHIVRLGKEIYERDVRHLVEVDHVGKSVAIDVETGFWAIGENGMTAAERLRKKRPDAIEICGLTVGRATYIRRAN